MRRSSNNVVPEEEAAGQRARQQQLPSNAVLRSEIQRLLPTVDVTTTGVKAFTKVLAHDCGIRSVDLKPRADFIKQTLTDAINALPESSDSESEESDAEADDEENTTGRKRKSTAEPKKKKSSKKRKTTATTTPPKKTKKAATGLMAQKEITPALAAFLGTAPTEMIARTEVVKRLWAYIKDHELQTPDDRRTIRLDDKLRAVFGNKVQTFTMFTMNKYISAQLAPYPPVDLTTLSAASLKTKQEKKRKKAEQHKEGTKQKKPRPAGRQPPYRLSEALRAVVGFDILPRPQVVKLVWVYIKQHQLQDPDNKRLIRCDPALQQVMDDQPEVSMFQMQKLLTPHLLEKLDKAAYQHADTEAVLSTRSSKES